jgi:hypothetical protein
MVRNFLGVLCLVFVTWDNAQAVEYTMYYLGACNEVVDARRIAELDKKDHNAAMQEAVRLKWAERCTNVVIVGSDLHLVRPYEGAWEVGAYPYPYLNYNKYKAFADFNTRKTPPPKRTMYLYLAPPMYVDELLK